MEKPARAQQELAPFLPTLFPTCSGCGRDWTGQNPNVFSVPRTYRYQAVSEGSPNSKRTKSLDTAPCLCSCHPQGFVTLVTLVHQCFWEQWRSWIGSCWWDEGRELWSILSARGQLGWLFAWPLLSLSSVPRGIGAPSGVVQ